MKVMHSTVNTIALILAIILVIPTVSSQSINYIEVNGTAFTQPDTINITCWSDNSSSETYLWNNYTGVIELMFPNGTGVQTNITDSSNLNPGNYSVYCNSTWNSTLAWQTFSVKSAITTTTTVQETTIETTTLSTIIPTTSTVPPIVEDKEPPVWSNLRHNPSVVRESDSVNIMVDWSDNVDLDNVIIYENSTGVWKEHFCDKATGQCSLGIVNLSLTSTGLTSSFLIIAFIATFAVIIIILIKVVRAPRIISSFLSIVIFIFLLSIFLSPELSRNISRTFSKLGIISLGPIKTFSHTILASELNAGEVVGYYSYANDTAGNFDMTEIKSFTVQPAEVVSKKIETSIIKEEQEEAEIDKPVKWRKELVISNPSSKEVKGYEVIGPPKEANNIVVKDETGTILYRNKSSWETDITGKENISYFVEYETKAPYKEENIIQPFLVGKKYLKRIAVKSDFSGHYKNVKAYTDIPEELSKENYKIKLYRIMDNSKIDITDNPSYNVKFVDSDNDGFNDRMEWTVPILSEENFEVEASITIINVQSYPTVWGNWTVRFNTTGTADLKITPINNTNFDVDIQFLELRCGNNKVNPVYDGKSVFYDGWNCSEEGTIINQVLKEGKHTLEFRFGDDVEYAYNQAGLEYYINTSEAEQSTGTSWKEALSLTWNDPSDSKWLVLASWESRHNATGANGNYQVSKDGIEQTIYTERVLQANTEYISYFFPQVHEGDSGTVKYSINFNATSGTAYIRRTRIIAIRLDNLVNAHYNYTFNGNQVNNLDATWGGSEDISITFNPPTAGYYLVLASLAQSAGNTGYSGLSTVNIDSGTEYIPSATGSYQTIEDAATTEFHPFQAMAVRQFDTSTHTISLQSISESGSTTSDIRDRSLIVVRLSDVFNFWSVSNVAQTTTTSTAFQNKSTLTIPSGNEGNYMILSMFTLKGSSTSRDFDSRTFSDDYGEIGKYQRFMPRDTSDYITSGMVYNTTFDSNQHVIKNQFRRVGSSGTASAKNSEIIAIKLNATAVTTHGWLNVTLDTPEPTTCKVTTPCDKTQYETFWVNATVECKEASCGTVSGSVRYNDSLGEPNILMSTTEGDTPFYIVGEASQPRDDDYVYKYWNFSVLGSGITRPSGLAYNGTHFWVSNRSTVNSESVVYRYNKTGYWDGWSITAPNGQTLLEGVYVNSTRIGITGNSGTKNVTFFDINTGNMISTFSTALTGVPSGIVFNETYVWVVQSGGSIDRIYRYPSGGGPQTLEIDLCTDPNSPCCDTGNACAPDGLEWNGTLWFILDSGDDKVYAFNSTQYYVNWNFSVLTEPWGLDWEESENNFYVVNYSTTRPYVFRYEKDTGETVGINPISCGPMNQGDVCKLNWVVNATSSSGDYKIDVNVSSSDSNVGNNDTLNAYLRMGGGLSFDIQLSGEPWVSSSKTKPGTLTTPINFTATSKTEYNVIPCVYNSNSCQDATTPIFNFTNTGNVAEKWNISLSQALPSYIHLYGNTVNSRVGETEITTSGWIFSNNIHVNGYAEVWLWADYLNAPSGPRIEIAINHTSMSAT